MTKLRRLRMAQVADKVGLPRSTIYEKIKDGSFPAQRKDGSSAFWLEHELDAWIIKVHNLDAETLTQNDELEA